MPTGALAAAWLFESGDNSFGWGRDAERDSWPRSNGSNAEVPKLASSGFFVEARRVVTLSSAAARRAVAGAVKACAIWRRHASVKEESLTTTGQCADGVGMGSRDHEKRFWSAQLDTEMDKRVERLVHRYGSDAITMLKAEVHSFARRFPTKPPHMAWARALNRTDEYFRSLGHLTGACDSDGRRQSITEFRRLVDEADDTAEHRSPGWPVMVPTPTQATAHQPLMPGNPTKIEKATCASGPMSADDVGPHESQTEVAGREVAEERAESRARRALEEAVLTFRTRCAELAAENQLLRHEIDAKESELTQLTAQRVSLEGQLNDLSLMLESLKDSERVARSDSETARSAHAEVLRTLECARIERAEQALLLSSLESAKGELEERLERANTSIEGALLRATLLERELELEKAVRAQAESEYAARTKQAFETIGALQSRCLEIETAAASATRAHQALLERVEQNLRPRQRRRLEAPTR